MLFAPRISRRKTQLMGPGDIIDSLSSWFTGEGASSTGDGTVPEIELDPIDVSGGGSSTSESSTGWFDWIKGAFGGDPDPCATGAAVPGSMCYAQGWRPSGRGDGVNIRVGSDVPNTAPSTPTDWSSTLTNAISAISAGFFPKPTSAAGPTATPVPTATIVAPRWYQTTGGKVALAVGVIGGAAYLARRKRKP